MLGSLLFLSESKRNLKVQSQSYDWSSYLGQHHVTFPIWVSTVISYRFGIKKICQRPNELWADNRQLNTTPYWAIVMCFYVIIDTCGNFNTYLYFTQQDSSSCCFSLSVLFRYLLLLLPSNIYTGVVLYVSWIGIVIKVDAHTSFICTGRHICITKYPLHFAQLCRSVLLYLRDIYTVLYLCDNDGV